MTAYELLLEKLLFGYRCGALAEIPLEVLTLDWEGAKTLEVPCEPGSPNGWWDTVLKVGLSEQNVLGVTDPPIWPIVRRFIRLGVFTYSTCAGHPPSSPTAYVTFACKDAAFGKTLVREVRAQLKARRRLHPNTEIAGYIARLVDRCGPQLSVGACLARRFPVTVAATVTSASDRGNFWETVSRALDRFDGQGTHWTGDALLPGDSLSLELARRKLQHVEDALLGGL